jgi:hypothetical protein
MPVWTKSNRLDSIVKFISESFSEFLGYRCIFPSDFSRILGCKRMVDQFHLLTPACFHELFLSESVFPPRV